MAHRFGGQWTQEKLSRVKAGLQTYVTALKNQNFRLLYVDAFAGTGYVNAKESPSIQATLSGFEDEDVRDFISGSAANALEVDPAFDEYYFVEKNDKHLAELELLKLQFPQFANRINIESGDANDFLQGFCRGDWRFKRAVIFLDPYGMQVKWKTLEAIARTRAIDLWLLFPLGVAVNRLLRKDANISAGASSVLDELFGSSEWFDEFFRPNETPSLFDDSPGLTKVANFDSISDYFNKRLESIFAGVADRPLKLYNSKNNPLYLLCFAVGNPNPKAKGLALKFANHILQMR
ncbi:MAG TPA: three-Cys-motif partner protein TcmP [Pyrinomonadaceae bacterium]|nr:three-Cys-motif partner protein TcmP [Pyrinomonadaceae bacterium]HMP64692.1 three-Cys-motif partner protein TcmP [Pyrinomonadaceae bacterium]